MTICSDENYQFQVSFQLKCKDCSSNNLIFQVVEQGYDDEGDAIVYNTSDNDKEIVLGVDCCNCGSGYSLDLKIS